MNYDEIHSPNEIEFIVNECLKDCPTIKTNKQITYYNVPCAFDIETTSFYDGDDKCAIMYGWTLGINNCVILGRTWAEFCDCMETISTLCNLSKSRRLLIFVHNLAFDMQFFRKWLDMEDVFAVDERKPVYALTTHGIEFRCSYILTGYPLEELGKQLKKYPVQKMVGDLDYSLIRHSKTPLTKKEVKYMENDVRIIMAYIQEESERLNNITRLPLTKTGYVRRYCRDMCLYDGSHKNNVGKYLKYHQLMMQMTLDLESYLQLRRGFQGGFTHTSGERSGIVFLNVGSYDFTSSYPAVMLCEQFPIGKPELIEIKTQEQFEMCMKCYCCVFDVEFIGFESSVCFEHPLSKSHCWNIAGVEEDNGRVVCAERITTTITNIDFDILTKFYHWEHMRVFNFRRYVKGYLPTDFVKAILKLYQDKTELKGVKSTPERDYELDYQIAKGMCNATYGMSVTDIIRVVHTIVDGEWATEEVDKEKVLKKENNSKRRFLYYAWGVFITAYARRNLFSGIWEFGNATHPERECDYIYADTDSIKAINCYRHEEYIKAYNDNIREKMDDAMRYHGLPLESTRPKTIKGVEKQIGVWDFEGTYKCFKALRAKTYAVIDENYNLNITISGVNKKVANGYLAKTYGKYGFFSAFKDGLVIPDDATGKMTHTYIDDSIEGFVTDYKGITEHYYERSFVHLEKCDYKLKLSEEYLDYIMQVQERSK